MNLQAKFLVFLMIVMGPIVIFAADVGMQTILEQHSPTTGAGEEKPAMDDRSPAEQGSLDDLTAALQELASLLEKLTQALEKENPGSPSGTPDTPAPTQEPEPKTIHTVAPGESLIEIARRLLGDPARYWELVELNKDRYPSLVNNPDLIHPGWELRLPASSSPAGEDGDDASPAPNPQQPPNDETSAAPEQPANNDAPDVTPPSPTPNVPSISAAGRQQMADLVRYAQSHHRGACNGQCFNAVWGYLTASTYGKLDQWGDLPNMQSGEARHFAEYLNASSAHLDEAGLQRFDTACSPRITSPHDPRIPDGAVIVVAAGSTGTFHATAGDIVVKAGSRFINDGPDMNYGTASSWRGQLLGVYVPR